MTQTRPIHFERAKRSVKFVLQLYAGCLFSESPWAGALLLVATAFAPFSALLGLLSVGTALLTAHALRLISEEHPPVVYAYSALFIGMIAERTFGNPLVATAFATFGAATSALMTASMRDLGVRVALPSLSVPFVVVYLCALGTGRALGVSWAALPQPSHTYATLLPQLGQLYFEALGALVCDRRAEVGLVVFAALLVSNRHAAPLTTLGFAVALAASYALDLTPLVRLVALLNAMFTALALGVGWSTPSMRGYAIAVVGALLCALCTPSLSAPFGRIELTPLSLPFNVSIYAVLLMTRQRTQGELASSPSEDRPHSIIA